MNAPRAPDDLVFGVSGVRGRVGHGLTPEVMARLAASHGAGLLARGSGDRRVLLGRDSRTSGPLFRDAAAAGLASVGCDVIDLGLCPTPTLLLAVADLGAAGGLVITASHNPVEWNAAKLVSGRGLFLDPAESRETLALFLAGGPPRAPWDRLSRAMPGPDVLAAHVERVLAASEVDATSVRARGFRIVVDACHGVGALALSPLLFALGCAVDLLHGEPTGRFSRNPEPLPAHLGELGDRVRAQGADLGLALDPDGDRLALVAETGEPLGEDLTLALAVERVLAFRPGPVVTNLSTSRVVEDAAARARCSVVRTPVGEIHVAKKILELGSPIGGEGNGGVIYPAVHPTRDAAAAAGLVLSLLAEREAPLTAVAAELPRYAIVKERIELAGPGAAFDPEALLELFPGAVPDRTDGVRLEWREQRAWLHVRASGTEPILRVIAEAPTGREARELVARARAALSRAALGAEPQP